MNKGLYEEILEDSANMWNAYDVIAEKYYSNIATLALAFPEVGIVGNGWYSSFIEAMDYLKTTL